ncbi:MAG: hypothetical protein M1823_001739 [Watsoniomyces obsoletus]|nr:MAG: hypothetical protein M1823_001739 [Watsoniomyces obsoletus]
MTAFNGPGVGDVLAVTKLAWDLYHNCYLVAREAPDEFRQMVNELASLQGVLRTLRDDVSSDQSFLEKLGDHRRETLERCLNACQETLRKLEAIVHKYRELGINNGLQFWRRIKWATQQPVISGVRAKLMVHSCNISLCMSTIGTTSLLRLEQSMSSALERQQVGQPSSQNDVMLPLGRMSSNAVSEFPPEVSSHQMQRLATGTTLGDSQIPMYAGPALSLMDDAASGSNQASSPSVATPPRQSFSSNVYNHDKMSMEPNVIDIVTEARRELSKIRSQERSARPLRVVRQDEIHQPSDALKLEFRRLADSELQIRRLSTRDWIRVAIWWLLKSRNLLEHEQSQQHDARGAPDSWEARSLEFIQAYVDLLKTSWILYDVILKDDRLSVLLTDENKILFLNVQDALNRDIAQFRSLDRPDERLLRGLNITIWEILQPEEEDPYEDDLLLGSDNGRWVAVRQERAGAQDEKVLFRTFVNAEIGSETSRVDCEGTPYMLLLWHKHGESEPRVTICNQSGTLGLTKEFKPEDIPSPSKARDPYASAKPSTSTRLSSLPPLILRFETTEVSIYFGNDHEWHQFMRIPSTYFGAVAGRNPRRLPAATESVIFDGSLEQFEVLDTPALKPTTPPQQWTSCKMTLLETVGRAAWRTTRRIVFNSSCDADASDGLWCFDYFLPLSRVQISRDGTSRSLMLKWSDCSRLHLKTDGNYNKVYSCVYADDNPNRAVRILFRSEVEAENFERVILRPSLDAIYEWSSRSVDGVVYNVHEPEPEPKQYKAILLTYDHQKWKYSDLFYMYRDTDYKYSHETTAVRLPQVHYTTYLSDHVERLFPPPVDPPPSFSHAEKKLGHTLIQFDDESSLKEFMNSLSLDCRLIFSRRVDWLSTKKPSGPFSHSKSKSSKGPAEVQVWQSGLKTRLIGRWGDKVDDKWMSLVVPSGLSGVGTRGSNRATLPRGPIERGTMVDMARMQATRPREESKGSKEGQVTIAFETVQDREEFTAAIERLTSGGTLSPGRDTNGVDKDIAGFSLI